MHRGFGNIRTITPLARLGAALIMWLVLVGTVLLTVMVLNGHIVNQLSSSLPQYTPMFALLWEQQPLGALQFISTKSLFAFAHHDAQSHLNLWTLEFDSITLLVYVAVAAYGGPRVWQGFTAHRVPKGIYRALLGSALIAAACTYMTSIEHCAGPTWVGFVARYGLGQADFPLTYTGQLACAGVGVALLAWGHTGGRRA